MVHPENSITILTGADEDSEVFPIDDKSTKVFVLECHDDDTSAQVSQLRTELLRELSTIATSVDKLQQLKPILVEIKDAVVDAAKQLAIAFSCASCAPSSSGGATKRSRMAAEGTDTDAAAAKPATRSSTANTSGA